jgi:hypothetical protein
MADGPQRRAARGKCDAEARVRVNHRQDFGSRAKDFGVDRELLVARVATFEDVPVEVEQ